MIDKMSISIVLLTSISDTYIDLTTMCMQRPQLFNWGMTTHEYTTKVVIWWVATGNLERESRKERQERTAGNELIAFSVKPITNNLYDL